MDGHFHFETGDGVPFTDASPLILRFGDTFSRKGRGEDRYFSIPSAAWRTKPAISRQAVSAAGMAPVKALKPWARLS